MDISFLSLQKSNEHVFSELGEAARRVITSGRYLHGPETEAFEKELLESCGLTGAYAVGVSNGLDALRLIFRGLLDLKKIRPAAEVLVPANTYIASILPLSEFGLKPVLIEPNPSTFGIDWHKAEKAITDNTGALLTVHLYGNPSWDFEVAERLRKRGILIVEDNAQAIGASIRNPFHPEKNALITGALGDASAFSFYPTKNIGALGDAGAVVTKEKELSDRVKALANYGTDSRYHNICRGYNCRIDELQAAFLRVKLRRLSETIERRNEIAEIYLEKISHSEVTLPKRYEGEQSVWHQFVILAPHRDKLREWLAANNIATDIHYAVPPHLQPCYSGQLGGPYPLTERLADNLISLPIANVTKTEAKYISETINSFEP